MQDNTIIQRIKSEDDPRRCQGITPSGQCKNISVEGCQFCLVHGGAKTKDTMIEKSLKNYRLTKYKARALELSNSSGLKSLRDEVAILRIMLEEQFNMITNSNELILQSGSLSEMILKIERLVTSCQKLEERTGMMLDKEQVMNIAEQLITIVTDCVKDPVIIEQISEGFSKVFESTVFEVPEE